MPDTPSATAPTHTGNRPSASRKLLTRKAVERGPGALAEHALEEAFPAAVGEPTVVAARSMSGLSAPAPAPANLPEPPDGDPAETRATAPESARQGALQPSAAQQPCSAPAWSGEDEAALQAMLARRRAAGYRRRGRDVAAQMLVVGDVAPNPGTVVATIVALVAEAGGQIARGALLDRMASAAFASPSAKPADHGWAQGYAAGALRDGFLALAPAALAGPAAGEVLP